MRPSLLLLTLTAIVASLAQAASIEPPPDSPLRQYGHLSQYYENKQGVPAFVAGELSEPITRGQEVETALAFFEMNQTAFGINDTREELSVRRVDLDPAGLVHIRIDQRYKGLPVIGGNLVAHYDRSNRLKAVNGQYVAGLDLNINPDITSPVAVQLALQDLESFFGSAVPESPQLVVFPWEDEQYLAWRTFLISETPMGRWEYFVDANTGGVIYKANRIMNTESIGLGVGVMGNVYTHVDTDFNGSDYLLIDYTRRANNDIHGHGGQMAADAAIRTSVASSSLPGVIASDDDNTWTDPSQESAIDAHMYTTMYYDWLLAQLGRNGFTNNGSSMNVTVDYSAEGNNNAYWNGSRIVIWSWSTGWRSLAGSPDVIAHEWGHAVTQYTSDLVYQREPGALNESFSDMMGAAFEFAHSEWDIPDWYIGENGPTFQPGFRSMANPHQFGDPDTYGTDDPYWVDVNNCSPSYQNDYCGVHTNSGVGNKWFYMLSDGGEHNGVTVDGIGVENAIKVAYQANAFYWTPTTDYQEAALGTISAANDLDPTYAWTVQVSRAWASVGIDAPNPELNFISDTTWGWVPLNVNFEGSSVLDVTGWKWEFGDGDSAMSQNTSHVYESPGHFDVALEVTTAEGTRRLELQNYVAALADTLWTDTIQATPGESVEIVIVGRNAISLDEVKIPLEYSGDFSLVYDSFSTAGCRSDHMDTREIQHYDPFNKRFTFNLANTDGSQTEPILPGVGPLLKLYMTVSGSASSEETVGLVLDGYSSYLPRFVGGAIDYQTASVAGAIVISGCQQRGDMTGDGIISIDDLVYLVDYQFGTGPAPFPIELGDVDCSGDIDVADLLYLVNYMFDDGPPPCGC